jgi:hypothetical protein
MIYKVVTLSPDIDGTYRTEDGWRIVQVINYMQGMTEDLRVLIAGDQKD